MLMHVVPHLDNANEAPFIGINLKASQIQGAMLNVQLKRLDPMIARMRRRYEVMKEILGIGESMAGRLLIYDGLGGRFRNVKVPPDAACRLCGSSPAIRDLSIHHAQAAG